MEIAWTPTGGETQPVYATSNTVATRTIMSLSNGTAYTFTLKAVDTKDDNLYPDTWAKRFAITGLNTSLQTAAFQAIYGTYIQPALAKDLDGTTRKNGVIDVGAYEY